MSNNFKLKKRAELSMSKADLITMAESIGISTEGTKKQLVDNINFKAFGLIPNVKPLLYIYKCKSNTCCPDEKKIDMLENLLKNSQKGVGNYDAKKDFCFRLTDGGYLGVHTCSCGEVSSSCDYLLPGDKYFTNSLCVHYLKCHYGDISQEELDKLNDLTN